jgi:catechol 2,3-dioxygenase-like lactoylglutathione lyase family enzyme
MGVGMTKVLHVKIPVTDLQRSVDWYAQLMDLVMTREFIEDDELRGAALHSPEGGFAFALRLRVHCASQPALDGFDVVALHMATRDALTHLRERCTRLGIPCTEIQDRAANEAVLDVADPDGTILRFYWVADTGEPHSFTGLIFNGDASPQLTTEPRLKVPHLPGDNNPIPAAPTPPHTARRCKTGRHRNARFCRRQHLRSDGRLSDVLCATGTQVRTDRAARRQVPAAAATGGSGLFPAV